MLFTLYINKFDYEAMRNPDDGKPDMFEVARLLQDTSTRVKDGASSGTLHDANGNTVGMFALSGR